MKFLIVILVFISHVGCSAMQRVLFNNIKVIPTTTTSECQFRLTPESHMLIEVYFEEHSESTKTVHVERVNPISYFPASVSAKNFIPPDPTKTYYISVKVFQKSGDDIHVGDFMSETSTPTTSPSVELSCVEHCDSQNSGGFCTKNTHNF